MPNGIRRSSTPRRPLRTGAEAQGYRSNAILAGRHGRTVLVGDVDRRAVGPSPEAAALRGTDRWSSVTGTDTVKIAPLRTAARARIASAAPRGTRSAARRRTSPERPAPPLGYRREHGSGVSDRPGRAIPTPRTAPRGDYGAPAPPRRGRAASGSVRPARRRASRLRASAAARSRGRPPWVRDAGLVLVRPQGLAAVPVARVPGAAAGGTVVSELPLASAGC